MFVDQVSDYMYVHLMKDFTITGTLLAKFAFEKLCARADCSVKHYQADSGQFSDKNSLLPAIISTKPLPLSFVELVHTIKMELPKIEFNS
jgi:hypothetical protein